MAIIPFLINLKLSSFCNISQLLYYICSCKHIYQQILPSKKRKLPNSYMYQFLLGQNAQIKLICYTVVYSIHWHMYLLLTQQNS